jgi:hypothetical protein
MLQNLLAAKVGKAMLSNLTIAMKEQGHVLDIL